MLKKLHALFNAIQNTLQCLLVEYIFRRKKRNWFMVIKTTIHEILSCNKYNYHEN